MKKVFLSIILSLIYVSLSAQVQDIITMLNGDVYKGYIATQVPGEYLRIVSEETILTVSKNDIRTYNVETRMVCQLPEYCFEFGTFDGYADDVCFKYGDIDVEDSKGRITHFSRCVILEDGTEVKFVIYSQYDKHLEWKDVRTCQKAEYDNYASQGIVDYLMLPNATRVEGQLIEQNIYSGVYKFRELESGLITTYRKSDIQAILYECINHDISLWEQVPYLDIVSRKDGTRIEGFIVSKIFGKNVTIQREYSDEQVSIPVSEIKSYDRIRNTRYVAPVVEEVEVEQPDLYVNDEVKQMYGLSHEKDSYAVMISVDSIKTTTPLSKNLRVSIKADARTSKVRIAKTDLTKEKNFSVTGIKISKKGTIFWPRFTSDDIIDDIDINYTKNDGQYIDADILFPETGTYVLFVEGQDKCLAINVIE